MAKVDEGKLNELLLKQGAKIFHKLQGFNGKNQKVYWMRRLKVRSKEADFLIISENPSRLAIVECGKELSQDNINQLQRYYDAIQNAKPEMIFEWIKKSLTPTGKKGVKDRGKSNIHAPMRRKFPFSKVYDDKDGKLEKELSKLIKRVPKRSIIGILLWYVTGSRDKPLKLLQEIKLRKNRNFPYDNWRLCLVGQ